MSVHNRQSDSYGGLGEAIKRNREDRARQEIADKRAREQAQRKPFESFESEAREIVKPTTAEHSTGWLTNPDRVPMPPSQQVDPADEWSPCCARSTDLGLLTQAQIQAIQAEDWQSMCCHDRDNNA